MKRQVLLFFILILANFTGIAQTKQASIKELFRLMKTESMFENLTISFPELASDSTSKAAHSQLMSSVKVILNKIMDEDMVVLYDSYYSQNEIKDMIHFYKSKTGKKMIATSPAIQKEMLLVIQTKYMGELMKMAHFKPEKSKIQTQPTHLIDSTSIAKMKNEFLDLDTSNLQNASAEQKIILKKAIDRMDYYVKYDNNTFSFSVATGAEVNMSDRLFTYLKGLMLHSNTMIKSMNTAPDKKSQPICPPAE